MKGVPKRIIQKEVQNEKLQVEMRGTIKATVLTGDPEVKGLVAISIYDSKPTNFLSTVVDRIVWGG